MSDGETTPRALFAILEVMSDVAVTVSVIGIVFYLCHLIYTHP